MSSLEFRSNTIVDGLTSIAVTAPGAFLVTETSMTALIEVFLIVAMTWALPTPSAVIVAKSEWSAFLPG